MQTICQYESLTVYTEGDVGGEINERSSGKEVANNARSFPPLRSPDVLRLTGASD